MIRRASQHPILLLVTLQVLVSLPYFFYGFGYIREEWTFLGDAQAGGSWNAALESTRAARPFVAALYAAIYGFAEAPMVWHLLLVALNAGVAVALYRLLSKWLGHVDGLCVSALWVVLPTHFTLDHWLAATNITLSLLLLLIGLATLTSAVDARRPGWDSCLLLTASAIAYDAVVPVALGALFALPLLRSGSLGRWWLRGGIPLLVVGFYVAVQFRERGSEWVSPSVAFGENLAYGLTSIEAAQTALIVAVLSGIAAAGVRVVRLRHLDHETGLVLAGLAVMALGVVPFATTGFDAQFTGLGDRMNMIVSIGAALTIVALLRLLAQWKLVMLTMIALTLALIVPTRLEQDRDWAATSEYARNAAVLVAASTSSDEISIRVNPQVAERMGGTRSDVEVARILRAGTLTRRIEVVRDSSGIPVATDSAIVLPLAD